MAHPSTSDGDAAFLRGVEQFNRGRFFEAHETWEALWLDASGADKIFLQAVIQFAAAFHHWTNGNPRGALSLLRGGAKKLARIPARYRGVRVDRLRLQAERWTRALGSGGGKPRLRLPRIERESGSATEPEA